MLVSFKRKCQKKNKNIKKFRPQNIMMFDVLLDINNLHNSLSEDQYQGLLKEILSKRKADPGLRSFHDYFLTMTSFYLPITIFFALF